MKKKVKMETWKARRSRKSATWMQLSKKAVGDNFLISTRSTGSWPSAITLPNFWLCQNALNYNIYCLRSSLILQVKTAPCIVPHRREDILGTECNNENSNDHLSQKSRRKLWISSIHSYFTTQFSTWYTWNRVLISYQAQNVFALFPKIL